MFGGVTGRRGGTIFPPTEPPGGFDFGPTNGAQPVRDAAGPRPVSLPGVGTDITAGNLTQAAINSVGVGGTMRIRAGDHRLTGTLAFLSGQQVYIEDGAKIKGSALVTSWTQGSGADAGRWFKTGQTQDFSALSATVIGGSTNVTNPVAGTELEDYYLDGVPMIAVTSKSAVTPGTNKKFMDRGNDTVWIGVDPTSRTLERLMFMGHLFEQSTPNILIKGGIFEHHGYSALSFGSGSNNTRIEDAEMRYGHLRSGMNINGGAAPGTYMTGIVLDHCSMHHGGRYNYNFVWTNGMIVRNCEFSHGNNLHFATRPGGVVADEGASKSLHALNHLFENNWSHDNDGPEWFDTDCSGTVRESVIENSDSYGLMWESNDAVVGLTVYRMLFKNNGIGDPVFGLWGTTSGSRDQANLYLLASNPGDISRCIFQSDTGVVDGVSSLGPEQSDIKWSWQVPAGRPPTKNWNVHDNQFLRSYAAGDGFISTRGSGTDIFLAANNIKFYLNEYHGDTGTTGRFFWPSGTYRTFTQWKAGDASPLAPASYYDPTSTFAGDL